MSEGLLLIRIPGMSSYNDLSEVVGRLRNAVESGKWLEGSGDGGLETLESEILRTALQGAPSGRSLRLRRFVLVGDLLLADALISGELALESCEIEGDLYLAWIRRSCPVVSEE
jgi:hypothetical protein